MNRFACVRPARLGGALVLAVALAPAALLASRPARAADDGYLGVSIQEITPPLARGMDLKDGRGVLIANVEEDGPADRAGLRDGDVILEVNGDEIESTGDFRSKIAEAGAGNRVTLRVVRDGDERTVRVTLGSRSEGGRTLRREERVQRDEDDDEGDVPTPPAPQRPPRAPSGEERPRVRTFRVPNADQGRGGYLGVRLSDMSEQLRSYFGVHGNTGVLIASVEPGSPAERAGLHAGDVLLRVGDKSVDSGSDAQSAIRSHDPGDEVDLRVARDRDTRTIEVRLGRVPRGGTSEMGEGDVDLDRLMPRLQDELRNNPELRQHLRDNPELRQHLREMGRARSPEMQSELEQLRQRVAELEEEVRHLREEQR